MAYSLIQRYSIAFILPQKPSFPILYLCLLFIAPCDSLIYQKYILPIISSSLPFLVFHKKYAGKQRFYLSCGKLFLHRIPFYPKNSLPVLSFQNLWLEIFENTDISYQEEHKDHSTASQARLQLMLQFIHLNYSRSISLDDIAEQAMVSKSTALNLFRKYLHITPVNYLINYRLKQAGQLLSKTEKKSQSHFF